MASSFVRLPVVAAEDFSVFADIRPRFMTTSGAVPEEIVLAAQAYSVTEIAVVFDVTQPSDCVTPG